jgi:hypothetical protein
MTDLERVELAAYRVARGFQHSDDPIDQRIGEAFREFAQQIGSLNSDKPQ